MKVKAVENSAKMAHCMYMMVCVCVLDVIVYHVFSFYKVLGVHIPFYHGAQLFRFISFGLRMWIFDRRQCYKVYMCHLEIECVYAGALYEISNSFPVLFFFIFISRDQHRKMICI